MNNLERLQELVTEVADLMDGIEEAHGLRIPRRDVFDLTDDRSVAEVAKALSILQSDAPMQDRYPDGSRAYPPFTPRQVIALARGAGWVDHTEAAYQRLQEAIREHLGRQSKQRCVSTTKAGSPCRSWALAYRLPDLPEGFRTCHSHASDAEREHSKRLLRREDTLLKQGIRLIAERETAGEDPLDALDHVITTILSEDPS